MNYAEVSQCLKRYVLLSAASLEKREKLRTSISTKSGTTMRIAEQNVSLKWAGRKDNFKNPRWRTADTHERPMLPAIDRYRPGAPELRLHVDWQDGWTDTGPLHRAAGSKLYGQRQQQSYAQLLMITKQLNLSKKSQTKPSVDTVHRQAIISVHSIIL